LPRCCRGEILALTNYTDNPKQVVTHVLRYDDFSAASSDAVEERLAGIFLKHRVPCTFGVIPFVCAPENLVNAGEIKLSPLSTTKADSLKPLLQAGLAEIALHGYAHLALAPVRGYQEFSERMPRETQRQLLRRGRGHLEDTFGVKVRLYVPPWNKLAPTTASVLEEEGLFLSSGGPEINSSGKTNLSQLPCPTSIGETSRALATAQRFGRHGNCVGTIVHDYDFKESGLGTSNFAVAEFEENLCRWRNAGQVEQKLISNVISADREAESKKAAANSNLGKAASGSRLRRKLFLNLQAVYWSTQTAERLAARLKYVP
jgi:predicted deacetylase